MLSVNRLGHALGAEVNGMDMAQPVAGDLLHEIIVFASTVVAYEALTDDIKHMLAGRHADNSYTYERKVREFKRTTIRGSVPC